ncbi:hypothetical protein BD310DRAFT_982391 [Dichomitus squalens]|uniref:F-box domain-containing protein n=1 Tax=Dichomitus squalens TaxID=114155 RepID=A0A4Q9PAK2_9APHY|nr:hypothetical protein BD310DRAFT_982391 [Dichomitus squalens]
MPGLPPLWQLLAPEDVDIPGPSECPEWNYLEPVISARLYEDPVRWNRFLWHAAHVRQLCIDAYTFLERERLLGLKELELDLVELELREAGCVLLQAVAVKNGGRSILPGLRRIKCLGGTRAQASVLVSLFTRTLHEASFLFTHQDDSDIATPQLLRRFREVSPFLDSIAIDWYWKDTPDAESSLVQELVAFECLRNVKVTHLSQFSLLRDLVTKPNIASVEVFRIIGPWAGLSQPIAAPSLCELSIEGRMATLTCLFQSVQFQALKAAKIRATSSPTRRLVAGDVVLFLATFGAAVSPSSLQSLELSFHCEYVPGALRGWSGPILPFREMRSFSLSSWNTLYWSVDDEDIGLLTQAWPKLERLRMDGVTCSKPIPASALYHLYRYCPNLREVSLPSLSCPIIGVHSIPAPSADIPPHGLQRLSVKAFVSLPRSRLSNPKLEGFARYILDLFPRLDIHVCRLALDEWDRNRGRIDPKTLIRLLPPGAVVLERGWESVMQFMCSVYEHQ